MTIKYEDNHLIEDNIPCIIKKEPGKEDQMLMGEDVVIELNRLARENEQLKRRAEDADW